MLGSTVSRRVALTIVFTALVALATSSFSLYIPATRGFFNLGEVMVYTSALIGGPVVGFVAGGLGSALADVVLGYTQFAPGTFVIKGVEGAIVGLYTLVRHHPVAKKRAGLVLAIALPIAMSATIYLIGSSFYTGRAELGLVPMGTSIALEFSGVHWLVVSVAALAVIAGVVLFSREKPWLVVAIVVAGGLEMVMGYYLYEVFVLGLTPENALVEVPFNVMQMLIGAVVAIPLYHSVRKAYPGA